MPEEALANATPYLQAFGHVVLAWLWLDVALAAQATPSWRRASTPRCATSSPTSCPRSTPGSAVVASREPLLREMQDEWF